VPVLPAARVVGLDFGHAHVGAAVADLDGEPAGSRREPLDVDQHADDALECAAGLVRELLGSGGPPVGRVVVGLPGPVDRTGRLRSSTIAPSWWELPVAERIGERLGLDPERVDVENDAQLGAIGEFADGAGAGCPDGIYVKASHGLGAGLVLGGRLYRGADGLTGEIGHAVVQPDGPLCRCGGKGCLETVVAVERVREQVRFVVGGTEPVSLDDVAHHAAVQRVVADAGRALGRALADVCNLLNPARIVLGGELAAAGAPLVEGVVESIRRFGQPAVADVEVVLSALGESAQLVGALRLAAERGRAAAWGIPAGA
jgi:predicted NBD/HSP70 family sugar kinase